MLRIAMEPAVVAVARVRSMVVGGNL